jgi:hypothetical protein
MRLVTKCRCDRAERGSARGGNAWLDEVARSPAVDWTLRDSCSLDVPRQLLALLDDSVTLHDLLLSY